MKGNSTCPNNTNPHMLIFLNNCAQHANKKRTKQFVLLCKSDFKIYVALKFAHCGQMANEDHVKFHWLNQCHLHHIARSEEHTSELQSRENLVCRLLFE